MNIAVLITTYRRPEMLLRLFGQIKEAEGKYNITVFCVHDGPDRNNYDKIRQWIKENREHWKFITTPLWLGKSQYYKTINRLYEYVRDHKADYYVQLPDDVQIDQSFFDEAVSQFAAIQDSKKVCLNLLNDNRTNPGWVQFERVQRGHVWLTQWMDLCFISNRNFFAFLNFVVQPVSLSWAGNPERSSGVGMQLSQRLFRRGHNMYMVMKSLVAHDDHPSVMHPEHRKSTPLITNNMRKDKVFAGVASFPAREYSLKETVDSILDQVDHLYVYLNDYEKVPHYLKHEKITVFRSQDEACGDISDIGKFYAVDEVSGYFITLDDDLIYPANYVDRLLVGIEKYKRNAVCTFHGRRFSAFPVDSYYRGKTRHVCRCLGTQESDQEIHFGGTGVMGFHTDTLNVDLSEFKHCSMADIWMGIICAKQNIPIVSLSHAAGWIKESAMYDRGTTIFEKCHRADDVQTEIVNQHKDLFKTK